MRLRVAALAASAAFAIACGAAGPDIVVSNQVRVVLVGAGSTDLPFDPRAVRIDQATKQLTAIAGHPLTFEIDVALLPTWRSGFEEALVESLENVAQDLQSLKEREPRAFAFTLPRFDRIVLRYSALRPGAARDGERDDAALEDQAHAVILTSGVGGSLVPRASVGRALLARYEEEVAARYERVRPEDVPVASRDDYFTYLSEYRRGSDRAEQDFRRMTEGQREPRSPQSIAVLPRATRLAELVGTSSPALAARIRAWLFGQMEGFTGAYANEHALVAALPPTSRWRQAETAWIAWLNASLPALTDEEARTLTMYGFVPSFSGGAMRYQHDAYPGFDAFLFGLREADAWVAAGHPTEAVTPEARAFVFANILCIDSIRRTDRCDWLRRTAESDADTGRLATALLARKDERLTRAIAFGLPTPSVRDLIHRVEADEPTFTAALGPLVVGKGSPHADDLVPEIRRLWRGHPRERGLFLYMLASLDGLGDVERQPDGSVGWSHFHQLFDGGATRSDLEAFLAVAPDAVPLSRWVFPARAERASFVDLLVPRLDAWLDGPGAHTTDTGHGLDALVTRICADRDERGMDLLRGYFAARASKHPGEWMNTFMGAWPKGRCRT